MLVIIQNELAMSIRKLRAALVVKKFSGGVESLHHFHHARRRETESWGIQNHYLRYHHTTQFYRGVLQRDKQNHYVRVRHDHIQPRAEEI